MNTTPRSTAPMLRDVPPLLSVLITCGLCALGCSGSEAAPNMSNQSSGGTLTVATGGSMTVATGGTAPATGGTAASSGGMTSTGGQVATGGTETGGTPATGGSGGAATGGTPGAGGTETGGTGGSSGGAGGMAAIPAFTGKIEAIAYSPYRDGQGPGGAQPTQAQVREDLVMLQPLVKGVRIYGTDGANGYVPALCDELGIDLHIGAWIDGLPSDEPNVMALATIVNEQHPSIKTAIVGNEVLARAAKMTGGNGVTEQRMIDLINMARGAITAPGVKIAEADTYPQWMAMRPNLAAAVDLIIWHTYAWWSGADINNAYTLVASRYQDMLAAYPNKPMLLGETGWPSMYDHMSMDMTTTAVGNEENQKRFYLEILGGMKALGLPVWPFSAIDENWKATASEGMVGAKWGIFNADRTPKAAATALLSTAGQ